MGKVATALMGRFKDIGGRRTTIFIVFSIVALCGIGILNYRQGQRRTTAQIEKDVNAMMLRLQVALPTAIWNLDKMQLQQILAAEAGSDVVRAIQVLDDRGRPMGGVIRRDGGIVQHLTAAPEHVGRMREAGIFYVGSGERTRVGTVRISISQEGVDRALRANLLWIIGQILMFDLVVLVALFFGMTSVVSRRTEKLLADVFSSIQDGISVLDPELRVIRTNEMMERSFADPRPVLGRKCDEIHRELLGPGTTCPARETLRSGKVGHAVMVKRDASGEIVAWFEIHSYPIADADTGKVTGAVESFRDVTEQRRAQEKLRQANEQLMQSEKMSAVGQLAAGVAHEINNPLGIILGFAQTAAKRMQESDTLRVPIKSIEREALRCKKLVQNLLEFSRQSPPMMEALDVNRTIEDSLVMIDAQARMKSVEIGRDLKPIESVMGDRGHIQQIVINLCNNAIDATPKGGSVTISTARKVVDGGSSVVIAVKDEGSGIPSEIRDKIFLPFFSTKEVGKGTGLGLSLVYELVKRHRGTIEVESAAGKGSTFRVCLPIIA